MGDVLRAVMAEPESCYAAFPAVARRWSAMLSVLYPEAVVVTPSQTVSGPRVLKPAEIVDVVAIQRGTTDPDRVIVLTGHIDSRVRDVMNAKADAPGADDDASGVAGERRELPAPAPGFTHRGWLGVWRHAGECGFGLFVLIMLNLHKTNAASFANG
jgi:hypothetical protein